MVGWGCDFGVLGLDCCFAVLAGVLLVGVLLGLVDGLVISVMCLFGVCGLVVFYCLFDLLDLG